LGIKPDFSILDEALILQFIFYPRRDWRLPPRGASDYLIKVEDNVSISCRFYPVTSSSGDSPCILFFHGNGEVACDYDYIAPIYNRMGIALFVADYRGYGRSSGSPNFSTMVHDAHPIFNFFLETMKLREFNGPRFIMGRSLGTTSALEISSNYAEHLAGLIVESGSANMARLLSFHGFPVDRSKTQALEDALAQQVSSITLPALIMHGEIDELIPTSEATSLYDLIGSKDKRLVIISGVGHNDIIVGGAQEYFSAIKAFVFPERR
jgi:hypothetical protein